MGKKTQAIKTERLEQIEKHKAWVKEQEPLLIALAQFADGCSVYAPPPEARLTDPYDHSWLVKKVVILPDMICEEEVTIPKGYVRLGIGTDHGKPVSVGADPFAGAPRLRRFASLDPGLEVVLPGGKKAYMLVSNAGTRVEEETDVDAVEP